MTLWPLAHAQGIDEWTTPSPLRKIERKGKPSLVDCSKNTTPMDPPTAPNGVTKSAPALTPAATGGAPLPSSEEFPVETPAPAASALHSAPCVCRPTPRPHPAFIAQGDADWTVSAKEFPGVKPATAPIGCGARAEPQLLTHPPLARAQGISDRTTPSNPRRKKGRKGASAPIVRTKNTTPVGGSNRFGALLGTDGNEGILGGTGKVPRGSTPSTTDSVLAACIHAASPPARRSTASLPPSCSGRDGQRRDDHDYHAGGLRLCLRLVLLAQVLPDLLAPPLWHPRAVLPRSRVCALLVLCHRRASLLAAVRLPVADIASRNVRKVIHAGRTR